ncbi:MAG: ATP-dependent RNA helicase RhlE [Planctomycetota bacterium]|jgi:ATP-dependent RNA helicase RhlE
MVLPNQDSDEPLPDGFDQFELRPQLVRALSEAGLDSPRPIQKHAIPLALAGRDVLGLAQTGTGKTAAFALPILQRLLSREPSSQKGPRSLVIAPTRELATQVQTEFARLAVHTKLSSVAIFGGVPFKKQLRALGRNPKIVVACPGRLLELVNRGGLRLGTVEVLVLDEADLMFDMGFLPDLKRIIEQLPSRRQNLLFSATMSPEIRKLADQVLTDPAVVELANAEPAETIEHVLVSISEGQKLAALKQLLAKDDCRSAIVFLRTKRRVEQLAQRLEASGLDLIALQGNMLQADRKRALAGFRSGQFKVLIATDIAARGLDIANVSHVINFDVPNNPDTYTHRIGRTGRSEQRGFAITFVTSVEEVALSAIEQRLGSKIERRELSELEAAPSNDSDDKGQVLSEQEQQHAADTLPPSSQPQTNKSPGRGTKRPQLKKVGGRWVNAD